MLRSERDAALAKAEKAEARVEEYRREVARRDELLASTDPARYVPRELLEASEAKLAEAEQERYAFANCAEAAERELDAAKTDARVADEARDAAIEKAESTRDEAFRVAEKADECLDTLTARVELLEFSETNLTNRLTEALARATALEGALSKAAETFDLTVADLGARIGDHAWTDSEHDTKQRTVLRLMSHTATWAAIHARDALKGGV